MDRTFKIIMIPVLMGFFAIPLSAQKGVEDGSRYGHGEDSIACIKNLSLYRENVKYKNYDDALGSWKIVFNDCPTATKNIYIDGVKIWNYFIDKEKDPVRKAELMDTLRLIYDQRIKYYKQEGSVLGRKGVDILRHKEYRTDSDIIEEAYGYLNKSLNILKNKSSVAVVATYMTSSLMLFQDGRITDLQVIEDYSMTNNILEYQLGQKPDNASLLLVKEKNDGNFIASRAPTCESLVDYFQPQFESKKDDLGYLQRVVSFMTSLNCETDPFYAQAAETLYSKEPSSAAAFALAKLFLTKEDYTKSMAYYEEAINSEENPDKKADYYYQLAFIINAKLEQPQKARSYALEAIKLRPDWGDPYILIGDAYVSAKNCFDDEFEKTTIYWVAVDKFAKAKSVDSAVAEKANNRISTYSKYFPDVETVFFYSLQEGDSYNVGCWINETTKVRPR
ncbi:MAG TPA: tetratricopeptide repeat protein [Bacteroides sp.]|nr:tetratricopeptide repeat protein [Bacteroides sp.]